MRERQVDDRVLRQNPPYVLLEVPPLVRTPEIIDDEKAASEQVIAQTLHFRLVQRHAADFDCVQEREHAKPRVIQRYCVVRLIRIDLTYEPLHYCNELLVALWKVDRPGTTVTTKPAARVDRAREIEGM